MRLAEACMGERSRRLVVPSLEEVAVVVWEVEALAECGDVEQAKRMTAVKYRRVTRQPGEHGGRVIIAPAREVPEGT